ncbi:PstS family phosphate ABC transporter substrate-binding protein [Treponema zuelzerae]|uniref:Phosphate-binding protein n=1 Tax=Teretinema zuelzerae TaxID=156 RepID=A0AAE3EKS6_9SPIR|nr:PstS family phosphate ABC transporter substrate-binding protein [Teretinema zuelzerae]MCD1655701.1 PstS family phosphate ABC transporter substrate-binding protein [Teretinema zuelzerae]
MKRSIALTALVLTAAFAVAQSSAGKFPWLDKMSDDPDKMLPGVDPTKVTGNIVTSGSSTVFPLSEAVTELFVKEGYTGQISIDSIGSGGGLERFGKGELDVANASRGIKASEIEKATASYGSDPIEIRVGTDALAVCVSSKNTFAKDVTKEELAKIFSDAVYWSDVRASWPKKEIKRYIPGTDSGTFDYFTEEIFKKKKEPILGAKNLQMSEDDNVLVQGISGSEYAVGFFGYAYFNENKSRLKALSIGGVVPNQESVDKATYPLARPLFMYVTGKTLNDKPQVAAFINFYLSNVNRVIKRVGYFPAPAADLKKAKQAWLDATKGRY